jgi:hypothetical protein
MQTSKWGTRPKESKYLKLDDGPVNVVFVGQPSIEDRHFIGRQPTACDGDNCRLCAEGNAPRRRFSFVVRVPGDSRSRQLELTEAACRQLERARDACEAKGLDFYEQTIRCVREGSGFDTKYEFVVLAPAANGAVGGDDNIPF